MWDIVSFGNVMTLNVVFNAISVIFSDGSYKAAAIAVALFVSVGMAFQSLSAGKQELPYARLLAGIIVYSMGFNTLTNVSIENRYDGVVTKIDNIPVAIAVPASLISQIGLVMTQKVETAFGVPDSLARVSDGGYLAPLRVYAKYRDLSMKQCPAGANASSNSAIDLCKSIKAYYADCTMVKASRDNAYLDLREESKLTAMRFNSAAYSTVIVDGSNQDKFVSCEAAYTLISSAFNGSVFDQMMASISGELGTRTAETPLGRTQDAFLAVQADSSKAREFAINTFLKKASEQGELSYLSDVGALDMAENLNSSIEQRNYEWALQGELFTQIVSQFISILECIIYALAPFIGLMVLTGALGAKSFVLYLQMLGVIQLMPSMLVVCQNIIMTDIAEYEAILATRYHVGSDAYFIAITDKAKELMGLGGMISATVVPALAMSIVTGSGMAVMGAMKSIGGPAKDSDAIADSIGQGGSTVDMSGLNTGAANSHGNVFASSDKGMLAKISSKSSLDNTVKAAESKSKTAENALTQTRTDGVEKIVSNQSSNVSGATLGKSMLSSTSDTQEWGTQTAQNLVEKYGFSTLDGATKAVGALSLGGRLGVGADVSQRFTEGQLNAEDSDAFQKLVSSGEANKISAGFQEQFMSNDTDTKQLTTGVAFADKELNKTDVARKDAETAKTEYQNAQEYSNAMSVGADNPEMMYRTFGAIESIQNANREKYQTLDSTQKQDYTDRYNSYTSSGGTTVDENTAALMAMSYALSNSGDIDEFHAMLANNIDFSSDKTEKNADSVDVENKTGVTNKPDGAIPTREEADPKTVSTLKSTNKPIYSESDIKEKIKTNNAEVQADATLDKKTQEDKADKKFKLTNNDIDTGKTEIQEKSNHIMDENMAYQAKEMGAALLDWIGHNLTTSQLAEHYQGFKEMFGGDVADAVFNDYKEKYNNSDAIQALQSLDGQGTNSQPVTQEAILDKFDSKIEDEQKQSEVAQRMADDTYLDADSRAVYQSQADKHSEMAEALEAEKMYVVNNEPYTLNPELDSDKDDHRSELKGKIMSLNGLNEKLDTIQENNPTMVGGYYTDLQNSNNEAIAFYSEQIENLDNGKPYRLDINDEQASGNTDIDVPTFMPEPQVASTNNVEINNDSDDFLETEPDDDLENFKLS